jgi:hypothetical protein
MTGNHYCFSHKYNSKPAFTGVKGYDRVAFLEDAASIQLILSQAMQGLLDRTLDHHSARSMFYGCAVATGLVRLDMMNQRWLAENKQPFPEPVAETTNNESFEPLGVDEEYRGPTGTFEPQWSWSKYLYEKECEELGQIRPTCAADFPASGWLTEEEMKETNEEWAKRTKGRQLALYERTKAAERERHPERFYIPRPESKSETNPEPKSAPSESNCDPNLAPTLNPIAAPSPEKNSEPRDTNNSDTPKPTASRQQPCTCGGLYGGDPCDQCLDRQQRNASPARDYTPYTGSFDLKATAETDSCNPELGTPKAERPCVVEVVNNPKTMIPKAQKTAHKGGTLSRRPKCTRTTTLPLLSLDQSATRFFASAGLTVASGGVSRNPLPVDTPGRRHRASRPDSGRQ